MIELRSGVPGSGKTLNAVVALFRLVSRWEKHPEEARPIFVLGIPELNIPHSLVPLLSVQISKAGAPSLVPDWDAMPDGSLVLIDECQGVFPPRSTASTAPVHVAWLNVHRHRGFDIWLITQHPKLIDVSVRALVGKHQHFRRLFGGMRAAVYEWDACSDSLSGTKTAVISHFAYPKKAYQFYKSAEIHTKQSFKLPRWLLIPAFGLVLAAVFFPKAYAVIFQGVTGKGTSSESAPKQAALPASVGASVDQKSAFVPSVINPASSVLPSDFNPPAPAEKIKVERTVQQMKLAHGVYGDDPDESSHYTPTQIERQKKSVHVLNTLDDQRTALFEYHARKDDFRIPITFNKPEISGSYR